MKIYRTQNASRNVLFGVILKVIEVAVPFALRTLMIYCLGVQYLGLNSLCTSILSFLNLAELGVGGAMVFSMYKPIAEDNDEQICALMSLYRTYYRIIGLVVLVAGLAISPFLPNLISGDVPPDVNIYVIYYLNLASTVLSYWLFAYRNSLLNAFQREDVISKVGLATDIIQYVFQIVALLVFKNYYAYLISALVVVALKNIFSAICTKKMYPKYHCAGAVPKELRKQITQRVKDLFTAKVGGVVISSADSIVISAFLGLTQLAIYNNYYYVISSLVGFMAIIFNSVRAGIGNSIIVDDDEKVYRDFETFNFIVLWIVGFCSCCLLCLYQPFMYLWVGEELMLDQITVVLFCVYFFLWKSTDVLNTYKDAAGAWHTDRFRPLIASVVNLTVNIILVQFISIYGIVISTIVSYLFVTIPWLTSNVFRTVFKRSSKKYYTKSLYYVLVTVVAAVVTYGVCSLLKNINIGTFIIQMLICCIVPNVVMMIFYHRLKEFQNAKLKVFQLLSASLKNKLMKQKETK